MANRSLISYYITIINPLLVFIDIGSSFIIIIICILTNLPISISVYGLFNY